MNFSKTFLSAGLAILATSAFAQDNPHNGYSFWLPNGKLTVGDAASEKTFQFDEDGANATFTVPLRRTRFDTPRGNLVVVTSGGTVLTARSSGVEAMSLDPVNPASQVGVFVIPVQPAGTKEISLTASRPTLPRAFRFYYTDDLLRWPGLSHDGKPVTAASLRYAKGLTAFFRGDYTGSRASFVALNKVAPSRDVRRFIRWNDAEMRFSKVTKKDAKGYYNLGLYGMVNGFWELAERSFRASTAADPKNPDAWFMLGDAASYAGSDLEDRFARVYPYYKKAADLYPTANSNTYRNHIGLFKAFRVAEGDGTKVLTMTPEQIADTKQKWDFMSAIMASASKGALRLENTFVEYDKEFDNTAHFDPVPFKGLFEPGTVDALVKHTGWGASDALGHDCGPDRSASINMGIREWDVILHEWNHTLDWLMIGSGLGIGVPATHSSDWCGFQPISSMGMGHHSCNRYYMTPGMYRGIRGSDVPTTPWIEEWLITDPTDWAGTGNLPISEADHNRLRLDAHRAAPPVSPTEAPDKGMTWQTTQAVNGYVDLGTIERQASKNAWSFAHIYVWSPKDQKVRAWVGGDDNVRVWVNNRIALPGVYWSVAGWEEAREKDQLATVFKLRRGWNSVLAQVTNLERVVPKDPPGKPFWYGRPDAWGFSMRLCDFQNQPLEGVRWQAEKPPMFDASRLAPRQPMTLSKPVKWETVKNDYTQDLPHLTEDDLRGITGVPGFTVSNEMVFFDSSRKTASGTVKLYQAWMVGDPKKVILDNQLNWFFSPKEMVAFVRYEKPGQAARDLVFLRPEMYEPFFALAKVTPEAKKRGITRHADRVIGYFTVPRDDSSNGRIVLVVDTYLGDNPPVDEEDLLGFGA